MTTLHEQSHGWHSGELAVHDLLKVPTSRRENPTTAGLPPSYAYRVAASPLVAVGTLDDEGRPWTSIWGGEQGFARPISQGILGLQSLVDSIHDPVARALLSGAPDGEPVRPPGGGKMMSGLSINLETRDRVKLAGRMVVGALAPAPEKPSAEGDTRAPEAESNRGSRAREAQVAMLVQESLGNCPKYLNKKVVRAHVPSPQQVSSSLPLPAEALALIEKADMFFLSSTNGHSMDTNHRGGPPGFVRVVSNSNNEVVLVYPEYSGNRLYQTLGNLHTNPLVGIVVPDYDTSDVLYLTGTTQLLVGPAAARLMPHTKLTVKIIVHDAIFVRDGLPFRGVQGEPSPYNPPVRRLASECPSSVLPGVGATPGPPAIASLIKREVITPSIGRFTFKLHSEHHKGAPQSLKVWKPGQHVTLDFGPELDNGWSHMRDDDPLSLNDDFVRTFTVSNVAKENGEGGEDQEIEDGAELEITARRHGPATGLLWTQLIRSGVPPLEIPVLGFGGEEAFRIAGNDSLGRRNVFVAGGVGITPLLAQAPGILAASTNLVLLWSLRASDLALAVDTFGRVPGLAPLTDLFVTGADVMSTEVSELIKKIEGFGVRNVNKRRLSREDVLGARRSSGEDGGAVISTKYYLCASPVMQQVVQAWIQTENEDGDGSLEVVAESFGY